jgi:hypothetical protein
MKTTDQPSTTAAVAALLVAMQTSQREHLGAEVALWEELCGMDQIPAEVKTRLGELKAAANLELKKTMDSGDVIGTIQAGNEMAWAFSSMERQLKEMGERLARSRQTITDMAARLKQTVAPEVVATQIDAAVAARLADGTLMDKATVEAAVEAARKQGAEAVRQQVSLQADRTKRLKEANLPVLEIALNAETPEAFDTLFVEAQTRATKLAGLKVSLNGNDAVARLAFCPANEFDGQLAVLANVLAKPAGAASDKKPAPVDPLAVPAAGTPRSLLGTC